MGAYSCNDPAHADLLAAVDRLLAEGVQQRAQIESLTATVAEQAKTIEAQAKRIEKLEERVGRNSSNSSRPPSSDLPYAKPKRDRSGESSGRKQGGQPGHRGSSRALLDASAVDHVVEHFPSACEHCEGVLPPVPDGDPLREQITEIPPVLPVVTEHRFHGVVCPGCAKRTVAKRGPELPAGAFGPRAEATVVYLTGAARLSVRETRSALCDLFAMPVSTGAICRIRSRGSAALAPTYEEALAAVREAPVVHADETPWYLFGKLCWLWLAANDVLKVFRVDDRRTKEAAKRLLGERLLGVLVTDRLGSYGDHPADRHQFCIPHLIRTAKGLIALGGAAAPFGERLKALLRTACAEWRAFKREHHDRERMRERLLPTVEAFVDLLVEGADSDHARVANFSAHLIQSAESVFTFLDHDCDPSNNLAERSMRKPVMWRRNSLGSQSQTGCRFVERVLTAVESLRSQGRNVFEFLVETMGAAARGRAPPSLLPPPAAGA